MVELMFVHKSPNFFKHNINFFKILIKFFLLLFALGLRILTKSKCLQIIFVLLFVINGTVWVSIRVP